MGRGRVAFVCFERGEQKGEVRGMGGGRGVSAVGLKLLTYVSRLRELFGSRFLETGCGLVGLGCGWGRER